MIDPTNVVADWEQDYKIMQDQRAEIARLRLTDEEREAVAVAIAECESMPVAKSRVAADTLRALLARTTL
jgi:predicted DNA-binding transcriptional regulator YafY